jgi:hypothetical protein
MFTRDKAAQIQNDFKEIYKTNGQASATAAEALRLALQEFDSAIKAYKLELSAYAKDL